MEDKLKQYSTLATGIIAFSHAADTQVVYTNFSPDLLLFESMWDPNDKEYIDLNYDGIIDVGLYYSAFNNCGYCPWQVFFEVDLFSGAEIATVIAPSFTLTSNYQSSEPVVECLIPSQAIARGFEDGDFLSPMDNFNAISKIFETFDCGWYGQWGVQNDIDFWESPSSPPSKPFIGFRIPANSGYNYGWLRLASGNNDEVYIKDMAYQATPNEGIVFAVPDFEISLGRLGDPEIYIVNEQLYINQAKDYQLQIINMQAEILMTQSINTNQFNIHLDIPSGIYIAVLTNGEKRIANELALIK